MLAYLARRVLVSVPVLLGILLLSFILVQMLPGDPATVLMSPEEMTGAADQIEQRREELGLNDSLPVQYVSWLRELASGNIGYSFHRGVPVMEMIKPRVMPTVLLASTGVGIALLVGIPIGVVAALRQNSWFDYLSATGSMLAISVPTFFQGLVAIYVFALWFALFPAGGLRTLGIDPTVTDLLWHLVLPASVLSSVLVGPYVRYTRQSLLDALRQDYITTAYAKGVPRRSVVVGHALRNSLIPLITVLAIQIPALLAGTVVIEFVFSWPGMGRLVIESIASRDQPVILAIIMLTGIFVMLFNFLADVTAAILDPRIRL